jgi:hypothetical protein
MSRAAAEMKRTFISNLRSLAQLVREHLPGERTLERSYSFRETINTSFDNVRGERAFSNFGMPLARLSNRGGGMLGPHEARAEWRDLMLRRYLRERWE